MTDVSCPECKSTRIRKDDSKGELICEKCGLVISEDVVDLGKTGEVLTTTNLTREPALEAPRNM